MHIKLSIFKFPNSHQMHIIPKKGLELDNHSKFSNKIEFVNVSVLLVNNLINVWFKKTLCLSCSFNIFHAVTSALYNCNLYCNFHNPSPLTADLLGFLIFIYLQFSIHHSLNYIQSSTASLYLHTIIHQRWARKEKAKER